MRFLIRALLGAGILFAIFSSVDFATAARVPWWNYMFMWGLLLLVGCTVGAIMALRSKA